MKKILTTLLLAVAALLLPTKALAYSSEMAQLAEAMNSEMSGTDNIRSVAYDGSNLIVTVDSLGEDEAELLAAVSDPESIKPLVMSTIAGGMDAETRTMFSQILAAFNTNLMIRIPLSNGQNFDFVITPSDLAGN